MLELRLLSRPRVVLDGEVVGDFVSDKALALLLYLAVNGGPHSRKALAGLLWGKMPGKRARGNLRVALHSVKKLLPGYLEVTRKRVAFAYEKAHWIDVAALGAAAEEGQDLNELAEVVALYEDDFLSGLHVDGAPELEAWLRAEQERWRLCLIRLLERLADGYGKAQRWGEAMAATRRLLAVEPWRERTHRELMLLLARQGQYGAALAQYEQCRDLLMTELGLEPMPETEALYERISQLRNRPPSAWPRPTTPLVGREREQAAIVARLLDPACHLVTLYGPGGIGKRRLALAVAEAVGGHFLEGVSYVPLSDVDEARHLPLAIGKAAGLNFEGQQPYDEQLIGYLRSQERLLVLDNFEQLLPARKFVERLAAAPRVRILVASRVVLNVPGEWAFEVGGLDAPAEGAKGVAETGAVQLFLQEARRVRSGFAPDEEEMQAIGRICRMVEGVPLAIEQAASWLRTLAPMQLLGELDRGLSFLTASQTPGVRAGGNGGRQSMRAVLEQSWSMLGLEEKGLFQALSVFRGGFTQQAAEEVAGATLPALSALVEQSLVRRVQGDGRYEMHELLRQFAAERLVSDPTVATAVRERHAAFHARFLAERQKVMFGMDEARALRELQGEIENVRAAWSHALAQGEAVVIEIFLHNFWLYYELLGLYREGLDVFSRALERLAAKASEGGFTEKAEGLALAGYGWFRFRTGAYREALQRLEEAVARLRRCGDVRALGWPIFFLGFTAQLMGDYERAEALIRESAAVHRAAGNEMGALHCESTLAFLWLSTGEVAAAQKQMERVAAETETFGGRRSLSNRYIVLGLCALTVGDVDRGKALLEKGLAVSREGGDGWNVALGTHYLGLAARIQGDFAAARDRYREALALMESLEERLGIAFCLLGLGWTEHGLGNLERSRQQFQEALEIATDIHVRPQALEGLAGLGACLLAEGDVEGARELLSKVAVHPATAHPVRQQAQLLLSQCPERPEAAAEERRGDLMMRRVKLLLVT